jgi:hypothetical protein
METIRKVINDNIPMRQKTVADLVKGDIFKLKYNIWGEYWFLFLEDEYPKAVFLASGEILDFTGMDEDEVMVLQGEITIKLTN